MASMQCANNRCAELEWPGDVHVPRPPCEGWRRRPPTRPEVALPGIGARSGLVLLDTVLGAVVYGRSVGILTQTRNAEIAKLRSEGLGLEEIGQQYGLTRERVRQIVLQLDGATVEDVRKVRQAKADRRASAVVAHIRDDLAAHGPSTIDAVAQRLSLSEASVRKSWPTDLKAMIVREKDRAQKWSDDQIREALQLAATFDYPLRAKRYDALLVTGDVIGPSAVRLVQRFGTWAQACSFAGVEASKPPRQHYQSNWTDADLMGFVRQYLRAPGYTGSLHGFDTWRKAEGIEGPSTGTLRDRLGTWSEIKRQAFTE